MLEVQKCKTRTNPPAPSWRDRNQRHDPWLARWGKPPSLGQVLGTSNKQQGTRAPGARWRRLSCHVPSWGLGKDMEKTRQDSEC